MFNWITDWLKKNGLYKQHKNNLCNYRNLSDENSLHNRMKELSTKWNGYNIHPFKPTIVTLTSHNLLKFINTLSSYDNKIKFYEQWNSVYKKTSEQLYKKFNPSMIYYFNDEINLVFYHNDYGEMWANGNLHKMISNISSYTTRCLSLELIKIGVDLDFCFNCKVVQFDDKYETLNWIIWRQADCRKNTIALLYKCYHLDFVDRKNLGILNRILNSKIKGLMTSELEMFLYEKLQDVVGLDKLLLGTILKKQIHVIQSENKSLHTKKEIVIFNIKMSENFVNNFIMFIKQRYLV